MTTNSIGAASVKITNTAFGEVPARVASTRYRPAAAMTQKITVISIIVNSPNRGSPGWGRFDDDFGPGADGRFAGMLFNPSTTQNKISIVADDSLPGRDSMARLLKVDFESIGIHDSHTGRPR